MKKLFLGTIAVVVAMSASGQMGKVISASNYMQSYTQPTEASQGQTKGDPKNLEEAAKNIDQAIADPSTSGSWKAWWYRSNIYQLISSERTLAEKYPKASLEVVQSFKKLVEINDPKFKEWKDAYTNMNAISSTLFNDGVGAYQKKNFHDAFVFFSTVGDVQDLLNGRGQKRDTGLLNKSLANAGLSAENDNDYPSAVSAYKKMLAGSTDARAYVLLISTLKRARDINTTKGDSVSAKGFDNEARKYTDEALTKYPNEKELLIDKINFYITDNKSQEGISYIQKALEQDPKNEQLYTALGMAYEEAKDTVNARKTYDNLLAMNPNSFDANFHIGAMIFNSTNPIQELMNKTGTSKADLKKNDELEAQRNALFLQAKVYFLKAQAIKPESAETKKALNIIEAKTRK